MILNIHGYNSSGNNSKYKFLTEEYKNDLIISPTFDYKNENPYNILDSLKNAVTSNFEKGKYKIVVGSSLGGFYAYCLSAIYDIRTILINSSLMPFINLNTRYDVSDTICKKYIELFSKYVYEPAFGNLEIIVSNNDNIINHNEITRSVVSSKKFYVVKGEHHMRMTDELKSLIKRLIY